MRLCLLGNYSSFLVKATNPGKARPRILETDQSLPVIPGSGYTSPTYALRTLELAALIHSLASVEITCRILAATKRLTSNQDNTDDLSMSSPMQHSSPTGEQKEYMTAYTITSGQGGPAGPEQVKKPDLAVSDSAIRQHIETKVNDINSFFDEVGST